MTRLYNTGLKDDLVNLRKQKKHLTQGSRNRYVKAEYKWKSWKHKSKTVYIRKESLMAYAPSGSEKV